MRVHAPKITLYVANNCLTVLVALVALYIVAVPFLPQIMWWVQHDSPVQGVLPRPDVMAGMPSDTNANGSQVPAPVPQGELLIIPGLDMRETIHGGGIRSLREGVWRLPHTSTPDKGGNTVLVGHRFTYDGQAVFYHLDKVKQGDPITVAWQGKAYTYTVDTIKVVPSTEVSVEAATSEPRLTIYTCTPLWSAKDRLVIQAALVGEPS